MGNSATASFDADDSSSLHSSGNVDAEVEKECSENRNGNFTYLCVAFQILLIELCKCNRKIRKCCYSMYKVEIIIVFYKRN